MLGYQALVDLSDCERGLLDDDKAIENATRKVAALLGAKIIRVLTHKFTPQGVTCLAVISASHIAIHTWPEHRFVSIDIFSCSSPIDTARLVQTLSELFNAGDARLSTVMRGAGGQESQNA